MSKLELIRQALETNPEVVIVKTSVDDKLVREYADTVHVIDPSKCSRVMSPEYIFDFSVAPKEGLYQARELQKFMDGLIRDLDPSERDNFGIWSDIGFIGKVSYILKCGRMYFDDKIGEERVTARRDQTITYDELLNKNEFISGKRVIEYDETRDLVMRIGINVYPNESIATGNWGSGFLPDSISLDDLQSYVPKSKKQRFYRYRRKLRDLRDEQERITRGHAHISLDVA